MDLVLIDGPNIFNAVGARIARELPEYASELRSYMADWFDFHRLVDRTFGGGNPPTLGSVVFHSSRRVGKDAYGLASRAADSFWTRQGANPFTSCYVVDVPGDQRESYVVKCECGKECVAHVQGEKGVDNAMTVYMFESAARWETLCLFSHDVDFVPAVWALRRRGKQVYVAADPDDAKTALVRAAQSVLPLPWVQVVNDFVTYLLCRAGGLLDSWVERVEGTGATVGFLLTGAGADIHVQTKGGGAAETYDRLRAFARELEPFSKGGLLVAQPDPQSPGLAVHLQTSLEGTNFPAGAKWIARVVNDMRQIPEPKVAS